MGRQRAGRQRARWLGQAMLVGLLATCGAAEAFAQADTSGTINPTGENPVRAAPLDFAIPKQSLDAALLAFSRLTHLQVLVPGELTRGVTSPGVSGSFTPQEALQRLLAGTGLAATTINAQTISVEKIPTDGSVVLPAVSTQAETPESDPQNPTGKGVGYLATRSTAGTKTDASILQIPQTINVVTADQIRDQGAQSIGQALRYTPGVMSDTYGATSPFDIYTQIRGFRGEEYLDGLRLPDDDIDGTSSAVVDPYSLERVEVLKGPSSGIYGQSPPGGVIAMVSKRPTDTPIHEVQLQSGTDDRYQGSFDLGGPLSGDGAVLYRLTGLARTTETQVDHTDDQRVFVAPSITFGARSDTTLTLLTRYQRDWGTWPYFNYLPAEGTLYSNPNGSIPTSRYLGEPDYDEMHRTQYSAGYEFKHDFNDAITVRQNLRYNHTGFDTQGVVTGRFDLNADGRTLDRTAIDIDSKSSAVAVDTNVEAKAQTGIFAHDMLFGVDYLHQVSHYNFLAGAAPSIDIFNPVYGQPIADPDFGIQDSRTQQDQVGLYVQDQITYGGWVATLGLRHDWVNGKTEDDDNDVNVSPKDHAFSGRAGLTYVFDNGIAPYVSYSRSFRPQAGTDYGGQPFKPTKGEQYEGGIKYQPTGTNMLLTASVFNLIEKNRLTSDPDPTHLFAEVQTGEVRVRGFELEGRGEPLPGLNIIGSYAYLDSKITKSNTAGEEGLKLFATPTNQASIWADYVLQSGDFTGLGFGAGLRYVGTTYDSSNTLHIPDYVLVDAAFHYDLSGVSQKLKGLRLSVNAQNIFDKKYVSSCDGSTMCTYGFRRTILGTIGYDW